MSHHCIIAPSPQLHHCTTIMHHCTTTLHHCTTGLHQLHHFVAPVYHFVALLCPLHCTTFFAIKIAFFAIKTMFFAIKTSFFATKKWYSTWGTMVFCYQKVVHSEGTSGTLLPKSGTLWRYTWCSSEGTLVQYVGTCVKQCTMVQWYNPYIHCALTEPIHSQTKPLWEPAMF